jgi:ATP-dependent DNA helicase RecG
LETFDAEPKNPNIRAFFNVLTWADEIGSGVKNMNKFVNAYTGGAHPFFIEDEPFLSVIPMVIFEVGDLYRLYVSLSQLTEDELGVDRIGRLRSLAFDLSLKEIADWDKLVLQLVGSWEEKSEELLKKRGKVLLGTLFLTLLPVSLEELASILGYRSKERYRDDYVKPLKDNGLIGYTLEQANDPNQQYKITQRGINFLMGSAI